MTWRDSAKAHIQTVLKANPSVNGEALRKVLRESYPFGPREHFPYKVWCQEVSLVMGDTAKKAAKKQDDAAELFTGKDAP